MPLSSPPESPLSPRTVALVRLLGGWAMRLVSVAFGLSIEVHEVYGTGQAQWALVFLGLWFIGVPPALWFDGVWRLARIAQAIDSATPPEQHVEFPPRPRITDRRRDR